MRDSACSPQTPSLNEFQSAVDEVIQINLTSKIKEVSDKEKYAKNVNNLFFFFNITLYKNTDAPDVI